MITGRESTEKLEQKKQKNLIDIAVLGEKIQGSIFSGINDAKCRIWENELSILKEENKIISSIYHYSNIGLKFHGS